MSINHNTPESDSESDYDTYTYYFYERDTDNEYTLEELKHIDKETRESIIDDTVKDAIDIANEVEQLLGLELLSHINNREHEETELINNLLTQFRRIMNIG